MYQDYILYRFYYLIVEFIIESFIFVLKNVDLCKHMNKGLFNWSVIQQMKYGWMVE